jgi:hypothetical protein
MKCFNRFLIVALFPVYVPMVLLGDWMWQVGARKMERKRVEAKESRSEKS